MPNKGLLHALLSSEDSEPTLWERLRGKRTRDIDLPNESGIIDPKLPDYDEVGRKFQGGLSKIRAMSEARKAATKR